jgi:Ankyrin repeat
MYVRGAVNSKSVWTICAQDGRTALHYAVEHSIHQNDLSMTRLLLGYGADVSIRDEVSIEDWTSGCIAPSFVRPFCRRSGVYTHRRRSGR